MDKIRKAVIPAGGWGTRWLPASKSIPKEMLPIVDKPAIHYAVEEAVAAGCSEILIITGRNKSAIEDYFDRNLELETFLELKGKNEIIDKVRIQEPVKIYYTRQPEQKGLGHAVSCARDFVGKEPFAVLLPDDLIDADVPCLKQMVDLYQNRAGTIIAVMEVSKEEVRKYGIIKPVRLTPNVSVVKDLIEKPLVNKAPSNLAIVGRYLIQPEIFQFLEKLEPGAGGEIQLTDGLRMLIEKDEIYAYKFFGTRFDIGSPAGFIQANLQFGLSHPQYGSAIEKKMISILNNKLEVG